MKVVWTQQAFLRLADIYDFIAADSAESAEHLVDRLEQRAENLVRFPESGRRIPELPASELQEVIEGNYRLVYRVGRERIEIVTVFEGHMLLPVEDIARTEDPE